MSRLLVVFHNCLDLAGAEADGRLEADCRRNQDQTLSVLYRGVNGKKFKLFDIPTTMFASYLAIKRIFTDEFLERENNFKLIESREIANFERTLRILVLDEIEKNYFKFSVLT